MARNVRPTSTFSGSPTSIALGASSTLTWTTQNAETASISPYGSVALNGSVSVSPTKTTTYTLTATGRKANLVVRKSVTITVAALTVSFTVSDSTTTAGDPTTLSWTTTNATQTSIDNGIGIVALNGTQVVTPTTSTTYTLTVSGPAGTTTRSVTVTVSQPDPPVDPPDTTYGPRTLAQPGGTITLSPGANIQAAINAYPNGYFWLTAGVYPIRASLVLRNGQRFYGENGAILDGGTGGSVFSGQGWVTSNLTAACFRAHNDSPANNIVIDNLVIRNMPQRGIHAFNTYAQSWVVNHCLIERCYTGVECGTNMTMTNCEIAYCVANPNSTTPSERGGAYSGNKPTGVTIDTNWMHHNGPETKLVEGADHTFNENTFEDQYVGVWCDGDNTNVTVTDNVGNRLGFGLFYEISEGLTASGNTWTDCDTGVFISTSKTCTITGDTFVNCWRSITMGVNIAALGQPSALVGGFDLADVTATDNTVTVGTRSGSFANSITYAGDAASAVPYLNGSKNLLYVGTDYFVPDVAANIWLFGQVLKTWTQWQALSPAQDVGGTITDI